ncbi:adhesion G protein-coupled receptor F5-like [Pimephales promelas]|uniref:adhesion G protein-coupled receptor F5-like n=1 Tax=Pimephales promelas TaxID=90988 RepID=UPI001955E889|nr:adhesion G protein-coupled receptor F5-like [Pimephales promelas]
MAGQDSGKILKYFAGIIMMLLLTHECVVETLDFPETSIDLEFNVDGQLHHRLPRSAVWFTVKMSMKLDEDFDTSLSDPNEEKYQRYAGDIQSVINTTYHTVPTFKGSVRVTGFRPGSIIVDYEVSSTISSAATFADTNNEVAKNLKSSGYPVAVDAFAESEQTRFSSTPWYPEQDMRLECKRPVSVLGDISWKWNDDVIIQNEKYSITTSEDGSILTVKKVDEKDKGKYECIIKREINYILWQDIVIAPLPNINVGQNERQFQCKDQTVELICCEPNYAVVWNTDDQEISPDGCATLNHEIKSTDCDTEEFTCRLRNSALQDFSYGQSKVRIQKVKEVLTCINKTLGDGKEDDIVKGPCEKGKEGTITYQCKSSEWLETVRDCILQVIIEIEKKVENLVPQEIPEVISQLSTATVDNKDEITQSSVTVEKIVDILVRIAEVSQSIVIGEPVMKGFLTAVNVLVSEGSSSSWTELNANNTSNASVALLSAIENISDRLTDDNFTIIEKSIELNKILTTSSSYSQKSKLENSATEILIPQIPVSTSITTTIFTTLDNVLPTRNTSNKNDTNNNVRINGDVVVVKVSPVVNNISFAFDIANASLGNPQCVFWNFSLDAWDSNGCEVKPSVNQTGKITCECNHTTSFSILISPFSPFLPLSPKGKALAYITYIGVTISMAILILCLIIEIIAWKSMTRNDTSYMRHVSIVNIAVSLLIANICFIIGAAVAEQEQPTSVGRCSPAVFFMHFFYLALFFWMLISALLLFYRTVMVLSQMSRARMMAIAFIVGYGAPLLIAVITVASTAGPEEYITKELACWLNWNESKALLAFVIPALTIVAINLVVLIVVLYKMLRRGVGATTQPDEKHALVVIARCVAILTPIFGLTWAFGIGTMFSCNCGIHVVFALLNSLQGFFILVFGTLLDSKIREALVGKLSLRNLTSSNPTRRTGAGLSSSNGPGFFQMMDMYNVSEASSASSRSSGDLGTYMNA